MKEAITGKASSIIVLLIVMILLQTSFLTIMSADHGSSYLIIHPQTRGNALDGGGIADEKASTRIIGQEFPGPGGRLGTFLWSGDLDQDGLNDLAIASAEAPGNPDVGDENTGYLYIWLGSRWELPLDMDLDEVQPDILIRGGIQFSRLLTSMDVGDLNNDGIDDLILGISLHPSCGRVFILWGKPEGWPSVIDLHDPGRLSPNGDPYGFQRTDDYWIVGGHLAPVPWPEATYDTGDTVLVADIDKNGLNDLIFSSPGWHHIVILWGTGDKYTLGNDMTIIDDSNVNSKIGDSMDIGDIDNDGWLDLIAGAPYRTNEATSRYECGIVYVYYNISRARNGSQFDTLDLSHPTIWGSGSYDRFGFKVDLHDLDGDGFDDIVVGSPDADGPQNRRNGAGQIMVFYGGSRAKFERFIDAETDVDILIYGDRVKKGDEPGDSTGRSFNIGDIDGDGAPELVIGFPRRMNADPISPKEVGAVVGYETRTVFTTPLKAVDLRTAEKRFEFLGSTVNDNLGYTIHIGDINNDGAAEVITGAPGADGYGDTRVGAGEVYIFKGTKISVINLGFSGPGIKNDILLPGMGDIFLNFSFRHSNGPGLVETAYVLIEPDMGLGKIGLINGSWYNDVAFLDLDEDNSNIIYMGDVGSISLRITPNWHMRLNDPYDLTLDIFDTIGNNVTRDFNDALTVVQDLLLRDTVDISVDGESVGTNNQWLSTGSEISFSGFKVVYDSYPRPGIPSGIVYLDLFRDGMKIDEVLLTSSSSSLSDTVPDSSMVLYEIRHRLAIAPPDWNGAPFPLDLKGEVELELSIDNTQPLPPEGLYLEPDEGRISIFDDDTNWKVGWDSSPGSTLDIGSTVREFEVSLYEGDEFVARQEGGFFGSYYNASDFHQLKFERIDGPVHFPITEWEYFGPDPERLHFNNFSIRWNGWFKVPSTRNYQFSVAGTQYGNAKVVMDGRTIIQWSRLSSSQNSVPRFLNEGELLSVQIYYYFHTTDYKNAISSFSFQYLNDKGLMVPIPASELFHPTSSTPFNLMLEEEFTISVRSKDWVGKLSDPVSITGYMDNTDPVVNLSGFRSWYGTSSPTIDIGFRDPSFNGIPSSGIDPATLRYRIRERSADSFSEWIYENIQWKGTVMGIEANTTISANFTLDLNPSWRGSIQFSVSDIVGNTLGSSVVDFGIDSKGPQFELLSPNLQIVQDEGIISIMTRIIDRPGAGVDMDTLLYRLDTGSGWSDWTDINETGSGEEVIFELILYFPVGNNKLQFKCSDQVGNEGRSLIYTITTAPIIENRPPIPGIRLPNNGTIFRIGNPLTLDASDTQDDGLGPYSELRYTWISNIDGFLGTGRVLDVYLENLGEHRIKLYVDDGEFNISTYVYITLDPQNTPDDDDVIDDDLDRPSSDFITPLIFLLIFIVLIAIGVFFLFRRYKDKKDEETRLDYVEKTFDDEDYDRRIDEEESSLGSHAKKDTRTDEDIAKERKKLYGDD